METNVRQIKIYLVGTLLMILLLLGRCNRSQAQCVVSSSDGYNVTMTVTPVDLIPSSMICLYGYNFNYKLNYTISFSGSNIPSSLYTLQGNVLAPGYSGNFFDLPNNGGNGSVNSTGNSYTSRTDCNTATVASFNPSIEIQIEGPGISYRTISCPVGFLPVALLSFSATKMEEGIMLKWETSMEKNNDYFTLEKSSNAIDWEVVQHVKGAGSSNVLQKYAAGDHQPLAGLNYYRLKQTDFDGSVVYSSIESINYDQTQIETSVFPNPSKCSTVTVHIVTTSGEAIETEIYSPMGQKLKTIHVAVNNGWINQQIELPETGQLFYLTILQNNTVIGKHRVLVE